MRAIILKILIFGFVGLMYSQSVFSQKYADKSYYLVDSLIIDSLSESDRLLIDSLLSLYHQSNSDTIRIGCISKIAEDCYDNDVWPKYNQLLFEEAQEKSSSPSLSKKERDFIIKALATSINNMGYIAYNLGNSSLALTKYNFSLKLYQDIHDKEGLSAIYNNIGSIYDDQGITEKALLYYQKSLFFVEQVGDKQGIALAINNIGYIYSDRGQISKALEFYRRSIKLLEEIGDKQVLATTFNNVGYIYKMQKDYVKALKYYLKSLHLFEEIDYKEGIAGSLNNIGQIYSLNDSTIEKGLKFYEKSLSIQNELGNKKGEAETSNNIGVIYEGKGKNDLAFEYYYKALTIREEIGDKEGTVNSLISISNFKLLTGKVKEAKKYALKSFKLSQELHFPNAIQNSAELMSKIYNKENDPINELKMYKLFIEMHDSVVNEETIKAGLKHDMQYQYEKQALKDSIANAESQKIKDLKYNQEIEQQKTYTFAGVIGLFLMMLVVVVIFRGFQHKKKSNLLLEEKNALIEEKNREITDSINYAKRIQTAILPPTEELNQHLINGFVFYLPKDIVAGDFYWMEKIGEEVLYAAADCTGHGVPGAMISVVCHNALNRAVREYKLIEPAAILDKTRDIVIETFQRSRGEFDIIKDGMDIALCSINFSTNTLQFSGANNSLYIIRNKELLETKPNKQPVGMHHKESVSFTNNVIQLQKNDMIYTFSDGYADQFGGPKGKKFMHKQFKELLIFISSKKTEEQRSMLINRFEDWKGDLDQIDDICVIGVKI